MTEYQEDDRYSFSSIRDEDLKDCMSQICAQKPYMEVN